MKLFSKQPISQWLKTVPSPFTAFTCPKPKLTPCVSPCKLIYWTNWSESGRPYMPMWNQFVQQNNPPSDIRGGAWMSLDVLRCPLTSLDFNVSPTGSLSILVSRVFKRFVWVHWVPNGASPQTPPLTRGPGAFFVHLKSRTKRNQWEPVPYFIKVRTRQYATFSSSVRAPFFSSVRNLFFVSTQPFLRQNLQNKWRQRWLICI